MNEQEFKARTKQFGLRVIRLFRSLPKDPVADVLGRQPSRAGTSVGANYRAACRARSNADIIAKLKIVEEEVDEAAYWLEMLVEAGLISTQRISLLLKEANEILAMVVASIKTLRRRATTSQLAIVNRKS